MGDISLEDSDEVSETFVRLMLLSNSYISTDSLRLFWACSKTADEVDAFVTLDADAGIP